MNRRGRVQGWGSVSMVWVWGRGGASGNGEDFEKLNPKKSTNDSGGALPRPGTMSKWSICKSMVVAAGAGCIRAEDDLNLAGIEMGHTTDDETN